MRRYLPLAALVLVLLSCKKDTVPPPAPEQPVTKTVTFRVFAVRDYSEQIYSHAVAEVSLGISTIDLRSGTSTTVWDTTFTRRSLSLFPQQVDTYVVEKSFPVYESKQLLHAGYWIRYDTDGQIAQQGAGEGLSQWVKTKVVEVPL